MMTVEPWVILVRFAVANIMVVLASDPRSSTASSSLSNKFLDLQASERYVPMHEVENDEHSEHEESESLIQGGEVKASSNGKATLESSKATLDDDAYTVPIKDQLARAESETNDAFEAGFKSIQKVKSTDAQNLELAQGLGSGLDSFKQKLVAHAKSVAKRLHVTESREREIYHKVHQDATQFKKDMQTETEKLSADVQKGVFPDPQQSVDGDRVGGDDSDDTAVAQKEVSGSKEDDDNKKADADNQESLMEVRQHRDDPEGHTSTLQQNKALSLNATIRLHNV